MYARPQPTRKQPKQRASELKMFPAPIAGWISNRNLASPLQQGTGQGAAVLDNFFPTSTTVVMRRGKSLYATLFDGSLPVTAIFSYVNGTNQKLFASTATTVYDITVVPVPYNWRLTTEDSDYIVTENDDYFGIRSTAGLEAWTGATGGAWITTQFATTGGVYLLGVNGQSQGFRYDGTAFYGMGATVTGQPAAITFPGGKTTADMSYVWIYKNRVWFLERNSLNTYYLDIDSVGGAAKLYPLGGIFQRGGTLMWGATWSLDAGERGGLSEQMVVVSTEGEVAVFQGSYPEDTATWNKVGVYRIGRPLGNRAHFRGGGDIAVASSVGLVPLSKAITLDVTALTPATVSFNIMDAWQDAVNARGFQDWQCEVWPERKMAVISPPPPPESSDAVCFITNTETGAWARYTNWNARAMEVFNGELYFGGPNGKIYKANQTGMDENEPFTGSYIPLFEDFGSPSSIKVPKVGRAVVRAPVKITDQVVFHGDFDLEFNAVPDATVVDTINTWGTAIWGQSKWGEGTFPILTQPWRSIGGIGYTCALAYQVTSGSIPPLDVELIRTEMTYTTAEIVT